MVPGIAGCGLETKAAFVGHINLLRLFSLLLLPFNSNGAVILAQALVARVPPLIAESAPSPEETQLHNLAGVLRHQE